MNYWNAGDWIGIGPGAHGRFTKPASNHTNFQRIGTATRRSPNGWLQAVKTKGHGINTQTNDSASAFAEIIMMGLRLTDGLEIQQIEKICGPRSDWLDNDAMMQMIAAGWLDEISVMKKVWLKDYVQRYPVVYA